MGFGGIDGLDLENMVVGFINGKNHILHPDLEGVRNQCSN